jgi:6-phosphofructokinase
MGLKANWLSHKFTLSKKGSGYLKALPNVGDRKVIGVLHAGGPAPASNAAIKGFVEAAISSGAVVVGFENGFKGLQSGTGVILTRELATGIESMGGVVLGTSRFNPNADERKAIIESMKKWGIVGLGAIGGDDTQSTAARIGEMGFPVVGLPKTIDNDLPGVEITHGFTTFVQHSSWQLRNLLRDAATQDNPSIYIAEIMGRSSGALTLASGRAAEVTGLFIPEEFTLAGINQIINSISYPAKKALIERIARMVEVDGELLTTTKFLEKMDELIAFSKTDAKKANSAIKLNAGGLANEIISIIEKRGKLSGGGKGQQYGVFAVAEGLSNKLPTKVIEWNGEEPVKYEVMGLLDPVEIGVDAHGNPRLSDVNLGMHLTSLVKKAAKDRGISLKIVAKQIGYELRCADPVPFDVNLGLAEGSLAANLLLKGISNVMVVAKATGDVDYVKYSDLPKNGGGHLVPRVVDLSGTQYTQAVGMQMYKEGRNF